LRGRAPAEIGSSEIARVRMMMRMPPRRCIRCARENPCVRHGSLRGSAKIALSPRGRPSMVSWSVVPRLNLAAPPWGARCACARRGGEGGGTHRGPTGASGPS
jgi:hypothetical protein